MMRFVFGILIASLSATAVTQPLSSSTSREVTALFSVLEHSHCQFNRNGRWYNAERASDHLHQKYDYLMRKHLVTTTESFIDLAASQSSFSGRPYLVRCANQPIVTSKAWFTTQLMRLRNRSVSSNNSFGPKPLRGSA